MSKNLRKLVSKKKRRLKKDGFNLDLAYITDRIIAMGFPSEGREKMFRNPMTEVQRFLETYHKDHYKVYNLCVEKKRQYDHAKFHNRVALYPFADHNCPKLSVVEAFCKDVDDYLKEHEENVVAVHCKAGKGRTGLMICAYLLYTRDWTKAEDAMGFYGAMRTKNQKGVTIPSQRRYVHYFAMYLKKNVNLTQFKLLKKYVIRGIPNFDKRGGCNPFIKIYVNYTEIGDTKKNIPMKTLSFVHETQKEPEYVLECEMKPQPIYGEVKLAFYHKQRGFRKPIKMCHLWFNPAFVGGKNKLTMTKLEIDKAHKDGKNQHFPDNFAVDLYFDNGGIDDAFTPDSDSESSSEEEEDDEESDGVSSGSESDDYSSYTSSENDSDEYSDYSSSGESESE